MAGSRKAVHFGGGNIGRGFMAPIFRHDDYEIVFVDVVDDLINRFGREDNYRVNELNSQGQVQNTVTIDTFRGVNSKTNSEDAVQEIATADIVTCAVGPTVLKFIAPLILKGIQARSSSSRPVAVVACENAVRATDQLKSFITDKLGPQAISDLGKKAIFSNSAVDRIVPTDQTPGSLDVKVEEFYEWCIEKGPFGQNLPVLSQAHFVDDLDYYIERKLYTVNTAHATTAYFAHNQNVRYIHEAIRRPAIEKAVRKALAETSTVLLRKYAQASAEEHQQYVDAVIKRFMNPALNDTPERVGRGPLRKMSAKDRLVGPADALSRAGQPYPGLLAAMEMALKFQNVEGDEESTKMAGYIRSMEPEEAARQILGSQMREDFVVGQQVHEPLFNSIVTLIRSARDAARNPARQNRDNSSSGRSSPAGARQGSPSRPSSSSSQPGKNNASLGLMGGGQGSTGGGSGSAAGATSASRQTLRGREQAMSPAKQMLVARTKPSLSGKQGSAAGKQAAASPRSTTLGDRVMSAGKTVPTGARPVTAQGAQSRGIGEDTSRRGGAGPSSAASLPKAKFGCFGRCAP